MRDFESNVCSLRRKAWIKTELENFGIEVPPDTEYHRPTSAYGYMLWKLAKKLVDDFEERTLIGMKEYGHNNMKLEIICSLLLNMGERLKRIRRSYPRRFYRAIERLNDLDLVEVADKKTDITNSPKGVTLAQIMCDFQRKMTEESFIVSVEAKPEKVPSRFSPEQYFSEEPKYGYCCNEINPEGLLGIIEFLNSLWMKWNGTEDICFHWLFIAFPSPLKRFLNFHVKWPATGIEVVMNMHEMSSGFLGNYHYREEAPVIPLFFDEEFDALSPRLPSLGKQVPVRGFALTCNQKPWVPTKVDIEVFRGYLQSFQDPVCCKKLGNRINRIYSYLRTHRNALSLSSVNAELHPLEVNYITDSPVWFCRRPGVFSSSATL